LLYFRDPEDLNMIWTPYKMVFTKLESVNMSSIGLNK